MGSGQKTWRDACENIIAGNGMRGKRFRENAGLPGRIFGKREKPGLIAGNSGIRLAFF